MLDQILKTSLKPEKYIYRATFIYRFLIYWDSNTFFDTRLR